MELSWLMRLRIAAAAAVGVVLIGILAWPLAAPPEPFGPVLAGNLNFSCKTILAGLAFLTGIIAYFASWPYGREIGILAVPSGLGVWAVRSGSMAKLMQMNPTLAQRQQLLAGLKWQPVFWLAIVAVGFAGVLLAEKITGRKVNSAQLTAKVASKSPAPLNAVLAIVLSGLTSLFFTTKLALAQDVSLFGPRLGSVVAAPAVGQIVFAVLVSFGLAGFVVKKFLKVCVSNQWLSAV